MDVFWPDSDFVRARSSLHSALHRIRRALGAKGAIQTDFERYFVRWPEGVRYDVAEFLEAIAHAAKAPDDADRTQALRTATGLVRGEYLSGVLEEWCFIRRASLERRVLEAWVDLGDALLRQGQVEVAVDAYERVLQIDSAHERAHQCLMAVYMSAGDRVGALRQFEACQTALRHELGVAPAKETLELYGRIVGEI